MYAFVCVYVCKCACECIWVCACACNIRAHWHTRHSSDKRARIAKNGSNINDTIHTFVTHENKITKIRTSFFMSPPRDLRLSSTAARISTTRSCRCWAACTKPASFCGIFPLFAHKRTCQHVWASEVYRTCTYIYIYIHIDVYMYICIYIHINIYMCVSVYVYMYICIHIHIYIIYIYVYMYMYVYVYEYVSMYIYVHILCTYIYI